MIEVTVLMPAWNAAVTIAESIRSVQGQTYSRWKLLILDDASSDNTVSVAERFASEDDRITVVRQNRAGFCATLNRGLDLCTTDIVARLDADDLWHPTKLARQMEFLSSNQEVKLLGTHGWRVNGAGRRISRMPVGPTTREEWQRAIAERRPIFLIHSSVIFRREKVLEAGKYREEDYPAEDLFLWTRLARLGPVLALPEALTSYRLSATGVSGKRFFDQCAQVDRLVYNLCNGTDYSLEEFRAIAAERPLLSRFANAICYRQRYLFRKGGCLFFNGRRVTGTVYLAASALLDPTTVIRRILSRA